jgi:hypothetical protein
MANKKRLHDAFASMVASSYDEDPGAKQTLEMRRVFMAGAVSFLSEIANASPGEMYETLDDLNDEIARFDALVKAGVA